MCIHSALEQFLLLSDIEYTGALVLVIKPLIYIAVNFINQFILELPHIALLLTDVFTFNELITRFNVAAITTSFMPLFDNLIFNLINIQYYKLNFFLIFLFHQLLCILLHYFLKQFFS